MNKFFIVVVSLLMLSGCATNKKFEKATCQEIQGLFTKSINCLELKFLKINPKKYEKYENPENKEKIKRRHKRKHKKSIEKRLYDFVR